MPKSHSPFTPVCVELPRRSLNRRQFLYATALTAGSLAVSTAAASPRKLKSPNEKLDFGVIGAGGRGGDDANGVSSENIVAVCDVDSNVLDAASKRWPKATLYRDYRVM